MTKKQSLKGQAMTEYIIVAALLAVGLSIGVFGIDLPTGQSVTGLLEGVGDYYLNIIKVVSLPFP